MPKMPIYRYSDCGILTFGNLDIESFYEDSFSALVTERARLIKKDNPNKTIYLQNKFSMICLDHKNI